MEKAGIGILKLWFNQKQYHQAIDYAQTIKDDRLSSDGLIRKYAIVSDAWMALEVPEKAASVLAMAMNRVDKNNWNNLQDRFNRAIKEVGEETLRQLLAEVSDPDLKGVLTCQIADRQIKEEDYDQAVMSLSDLVAEDPENVAAGKAEEMMREIEDEAVYDFYAIGCLLPMTGGYRLFGERALDGIQLAFQEMIAANNRTDTAPPIKLIIADTGSTPEQALAAVRELADKKVAAIIGPLNSFREAIQEAEDLHIPIITLCQEEDIPAMGRYVFRNFLTPRMQIETLARYACLTRGLRRFAVLYPDEGYGQVFAGKFRDEIARYGGRMVGFESYNPGDTDFAKPIKKLAGAGFEALFIPDGPSNAGMIIPQLAYHDVDGALLLGTNLWYSPELIRTADRFARGAVLPADFWDTGLPGTEQSFSFRYERSFNEKPGFVAAVAYDTAAILMNILIHPDVRYRDSIIEQLENMESFQGVTGVTAFDSNGEVIKPLALVMIQDGEFIRVEETVVTAVEAGGGPAAGR
ncbi:MAG: penicillin-binding protein activator [Thermodesulfobacteriota bacterium]